MRRWLLLLVPALAVLLTAGPAAADPAGPTHYRSTVTASLPEVDGLDVRILGGDAYVTVTAPPGRTLDVEGYEGEPFLRIGADGTVERNEASPARWINEARFGTLDVDVPPEASADAPPRWEVVAEGGTYAWHDHRVHWMSPADPRQIDTSRPEVQTVQTWELELAVDGEPVVVIGELVWVPAPGSAPWLPGGVALLVAGAAVAAVVRRLAPATLVAVLGALAALAVGVTASVGLPAGADADPALLILPVLAVALAGVAHAVRRRGGLGPSLLGAAAGAPLLVWAVLWSRAMVAPIIPTTLPDEVARLLIAVALGVGVASAIVTVRQLLTPSPAAPTG